MERGGSASDDAQVFEALREAVRRSALHPFIERNPDGVAVVVGEVAVYVNPAWGRFTGRATDAMVGTSVLDRVHPDDRAAIALRLRSGQLAEGSARDPAEHASYRFLHDRGDAVIVELLQVEDLEIAGVTAKVVVGRDVTATRRLQARMLLADRMISVGTLAAGVAHEINNPLSYLMGNLSLLTEALPDLLRPVGGLPSDLGEALDEARQGAERVRAIVKDLQAFARADHQASPSIDVRRPIELAINMAWIEIRHRARLLKEFAEVPPVEASEARLGQVFLSLLLSAAHALPEGSADKHKIRVATKLDRDRVVIEISHDGPALPREIAQRVFDPFVGLRSASSGAGLGLSIAHSIVSELSGELVVETGERTGTLFRVRLNPATAKSRGGPRALAPHAAATIHGRVLVVDDEPLIASSLRRTLRDHEVTVVESGRQAIQVLSGDREFDLILCDLMMPELTGMDVYEWLKGARPGQEARMVFMSGGTFTQRAADFLEQVPNETLEKPFELDAVREFVRDRIAAARTEARLAKKT
ncbi:response regulator [Myxococcota bacterium]|nr:response regulator [Myxococcota bacterium]